jgi:hypothetical protein
MDKRGSAVALALFIDLCWACGGSPTQPARPDTPPAMGSPGSLVAKLDAKADELGSRDAVVALSEVIADASASTGATPLTYSLDFGDGFVTTTATARHVYRSAGTFTITATVTDAQGRKASESRQMTVKTLNGRWFEAEFVRR